MDEDTVEAYAQEIKTKARAVWGAACALLRIYALIPCIACEAREKLISFSDSRRTFHAGRPHIRQDRREHQRAFPDDCGRGRCGEGNGQAEGSKQGGAPRARDCFPAMLWWDAGDPLFDTPIPAPRRGLI